MNDSKLENIEDDISAVRENPIISEARKKAKLSI